MPRRWTLWPRATLTCKFSGTMAGAHICTVVLVGGPCERLQKFASHSGTARIRDRDSSRRYQARIRHAPSRFGLVDATQGEVQLECGSRCERLK
jgi:hypothetical protein